MSHDPLEAFLPTVRVLEPHQPVIEINAPSSDLPAPTEEAARAAEDVFAESAQERVAVVDAITLAAAGMLLRDIAVDTLATPEDEEEEKAKKKPQKDHELHE